MNGKESFSIDLIAQALKDAKSAAVCFGGGKDSMALLHMARTTGLPFRALTADPPQRYTELYYFIEKVGRLWGADVLRLAGTLPTTEKYALCAKLHPALPALLQAATAHGFTHALTGFRREETGSAGAGHVMDCGGITLVNPLLDFTESEIWEYTDRNNLPRCSVYRDGRTKVGCLPEAVKNAPGEEFYMSSEEMLIKSRLKDLGYI
ncbi:MAG TPA: phosphoadenosine phosphosulfate reductase family protein [Nitrospirota bacterium]|nr:phosphoadenosine phosphosulfate reductase family protein [Nitrospirota bacterium]